VDGFDGEIRKIGFALAVFALYGIGRKGCLSFDTEAALSRHSDFCCDRDSLSAIESASSQT